MLTQHSRNSIISNDWWLNYNDDDDCSLRQPLFISFSLRFYWLQTGKQKTALHWNNSYGNGQVKMSFCSFSVASFPFFFFFLLFYRFWLNLQKRKECRLEEKKEHLNVSWAATMAGFRQRPGRKNAFADGTSYVLSDCTVCEKLNLRPSVLKQHLLTQLTQTTILHRSESIFMSKAGTSKQHKQIGRKSFRGCLNRSMECSWHQTECPSTRNHRRKIEEANPFLWAMWWNKNTVWSRYHGNSLLKAGPKEHFVDGPKKGLEIAAIMAQTARQNLDVPLRPPAKWAKGGGSRGNAGQNKNCPQRMKCEEGVRWAAQTESGWWRRGKKGEDSRERKTKKWERIEKNKKRKGKREKGGRHRGDRKGNERGIEEKRKTKEEEIRAERKRRRRDREAWQRRKRR